MSSELAIVLPAVLAGYGLIYLGKQFGKENDSGDAAKWGKVIRIGFFWLSLPYFAAGMHFAGEVTGTTTLSSQQPVYSWLMAGFVFMMLATILILIVWHVFISSKTAMGEDFDEPA